MLSLLLLLPVNWLCSWFCLNNKYIYAMVINLQRESFGKLRNGNARERERGI